MIGCGALPLNISFMRIVATKVMGLRPWNNSGYMQHQRISNNLVLCTCILIEI